MSKFVIHVFGKHGCAKCKVMRERIGKLLERPAYSDFRLAYHDVLTRDGIVEFCRASCLNPNRIPALLVAREGQTPGHYIADRRQLDGDPRRDYSASTTFQWLGLQTDYDGAGKGVVTPGAIVEILNRAIEADGIKAEDDGVGSESGDDDDEPGFCACCSM